MPLPRSRTSTPIGERPRRETSAEELHEIGVTGVHERPATRRYTTVGTKGDPSDAASEQRGQQAMRAIVLIPAAVAVILVVVYFVARGDDGDDDNRGILGVLIDLLSWR
jgi:ABC-type tungstate transport system permease subunit